MIFKKFRYWSTLKITIFIHIISYLIIFMTFSFLLILDLNWIFDALLLFLFGLFYILINHSILYFSKPIDPHDKKKWRKFTLFSVVIYVFRNIIIFVPIIFCLFFPHLFKWYVETFLIIYCIIMSNFINIYFSSKYTRKKVIV
jgi:hypothetical protein